MATEIRFKALSSGIGLGHLRQSKRRQPQGVILTGELEQSAGRIQPTPIVPKIYGANPTESFVAREPLSTKIDLEKVKESVRKSHLDAKQTRQMAEQGISRRQAKVVYEPHSVGRKIKSAPSAKLFMWLVRGCVGWGLDLVMVVMTLVICSSFAAMAWRFGTGVEKSFDPVSAVSSIVALLKSHGLKALIFGLMAAVILYWSAMKVFLGRTVGGFIRD